LRAFGAARPHRHSALGGLLGLVLFLYGCTFNFVATKMPLSARRDREEHCEKQQIPPIPTGHFKRVLIIVFENQTYHNVRDKSTYFARLADRVLNDTDPLNGRLLSDFHGLFHPSYSNYLAMVSGRQIPTSFDHQLDLDGIRTIAHSLVERKLTWRNYAEGYPGNCFPGPSHGERKEYARKHVPFLSFKSIQTDTQLCDNVVPGSRFWDDFSSGTLPNYAFYSPDMYNDGHNPPWGPGIGLRRASDFLEEFLRRILDKKEFMDETLTVITFDESYTILVPDSNHIYTLFLGNMVKKGVSPQYYTHYDVLRTIEDNFGLPPLPNNAVPACSIEGIWNN
jgi:hypothetical protein